MGGVRSRKLVIGTKLLIVLAATIGSLAIVEVGLRFILGNCRIVPMVSWPGDGRCVGLEPGGSSSYTGWLFKVPVVQQEANALGYRGNEHPRERAEGILRIAVVGDSFTYGQGVLSDESIPSRLEARIRDMTGGNVEVLNFGIPGLNLEECFDQYRYFASGWDPDVILYLLFANDLGEPMCSVVEKNKLRWLLLRKVYVFRLAYAVFVASHLIEDEASPDEMKARLTSVLREFASDADSRGARLAIGVLDSPRNDDRWLASIMDTSKINWIDIRKAVKRMPEEIPGEGHYSPEGNDVVASALAEWLVATYLSPSE